MRSLLSLLGLLLLAGSSGAQIYAMRFVDPEDAEDYREHLYEWNGEQVVLVEVKDGVEPRESGGGLTWSPRARVEFFVQDKDDPSDLPYEITRDGELDPRSRKYVIAIQGDRLDSLASFMTGESFYTLGKEYERRIARLEDLEERRDDADRGSQARFALHQQYARGLEQLQIWLRETGYTGAANRLERDLHRARRSADEAANERLEQALDSVREAAVPDDLAAAARLAGGEGLEFRVQESQHVRMIYHAGIEDGTATHLLELAERAIDGFRTEFVDPYRDESFPDHIPDGMFQEYCFVPDDQVVQEKMLVEYYHRGFSADPARKRRQLESSGRRDFIPEDAHGPGRYLSYWRIDEQSDLEGNVLHTLGHTLARLHYGIQREQDWLEEGVGYYLSFALLNRNNVTCFAFDPPQRARAGDTVATGPEEDAEPEERETRAATVMQGLREVMAKTAVQAGPPLQVLARRKLHDFGNEDMAKSWAYFDFLAREGGRTGQVYLRAVSRAAAGSSAAFANKLRAATAEQFGLEGDALRALEERWEAYMAKVYGARPARE